ncbi:hypothetical protein AAEO56_04695 [Flavobacterium sp. DGU11]|uniref:Uncharacterized protein n=1 Tax=Flavobacterium arundinis TaxID=3139143 RepID=A0ABU9HU92_9FLAO
MKQGFTIAHRNIGAFKKPFVILVSNYPADNEVINWASAHEGDRTRSDVGIWRIKQKSHAHAA